MTLIELMVSISVLGIIVGPITIAMMLGLVNSTSTKERISDSAAAQLLSAYLLTDIQSSKTVAAPTSLAASACGGSSGTPVLQLTWVDADSPTNASLATTVAYMTRATGDDGLSELWRVECDGSASPVQRSAQRLVRSLQVATPSCDSAACSTTAVSSYSKISVAVTTNANSGTRANKADSRAYKPYTFTLEALRRETPT